jgi:hypothetical protein
MQHDLRLRYLDCNILQLTQFALHLSQVVVRLDSARAVFPGYLHRYFGVFSLVLLFNLLNARLTIQRAHRDRSHSEQSNVTNQIREAIPQENVSRQRSTGMLGPSERTEAFTENHLTWYP